MSRRRRIGGGPCSNNGPCTRVPTPAPFPSLDGWPERQCNFKRYQGHASRVSLVSCFLNARSVMSRQEPSHDDLSQAALLSRALRSIRRERRLRASEVARAMDMPLRSYEHFEAGRGRLDLERLQRFADATDSDPFAIIACLMLKEPEFAVRAADNKLMIVFMLALRDFNENLGDDIAFIGPGVFVGAFRRVFQDLSDYVRKRDLSAEEWLTEQSKTLGVSIGPRASRIRREE